MMKKRIIIEDESNKSINRKERNNIIIEWLIYMIGYAFVLILVSIMFKKSFIIDNSYFGLYALVASIIIYILNQTIKPILVKITIPITAVTWGLFYPIINVIILYITSFILGDKFQVHGIFMMFFIAILISILNIIVEGIFIKPIIYKRREKNE